MSSRRTDEYFSPQAACGDLGSVPLVDEEDRPAVAHPVVFERERHNRHLRPAERAGLRRERRMCHDDTALIARDRLREHCKRLADRRVVRAPQHACVFRTRASRARSRPSVPIRPACAGRCEDSRNCRRSFFSCAVVAVTGLHVAERILT
jgi:hypothetical protein